MLPWIFGVSGLAFSQINNMNFFMFFWPCIIVQTFSNYQLNAQFFYFQQYICYTTLLNMFRAARCSSSGGPIVSPQPLVSSPSVSSRTVCGWRADCPVGAVTLSRQEWWWDERWIWGARRGLKHNFYLLPRPWSPWASSPFKEKTHMLEPGIEPGTSWLVVRNSDHQAMRLDIILKYILRFYGWQFISSWKQLGILNG